MLVNHARGTFCSSVCISHSCVHIRPRKMDLPLLSCHYCSERVLERFKYFTVFLFRRFAAKMSAHQNYVDKYKLYHAPEYERSPCLLYVSL